MTKTAKLSNGLQLVYEQKTSMRSVAFGLWVRVGSVNDGKIPGIAHFIEHMIFKGNETWSAKRIASQVDLLGAQLNAFTEKESTCYYGRVIEEAFPDLLALVAEIVMKPQFLQAEVEKERSVILEEIKMDLDTPDERIHDLLDAAMFSPSPYGEGILGQAEIVSQMDAWDLRRHHTKHYQPEQMVLSIVGNMDFQALVGLAEDVFSQYPPQGRAPGSLSMPAMEPVLFEHADKDTEQLHLAMGFQFKPISDLKEKILLSIVNAYLGSSMSSRLFQDFREDRGWVYAIYSYTQLFQHHSAFNIYAGFQADRLEAVLGLFREIFADLKANGIGEESVDTFKRYLKGTLAISDESPTGRMSYIGRSTLFGDPIYETDEILAAVEAVDAEEVKDYVKQILSQPMSMVTLGRVSKETTRKIRQNAETLFDV